VSGVGQRFGRNLFMARRRADLSQEALAARAGVHRTEISLLENGERIPRIDTLMKIAGSLEVSASELLQGIEWKPPPSEEGAWATRPVA
jgi:transcriptional regulator with XRE-family HTH domain